VYPLPSIPQPDILRCVVIRVHFVPALLALELFTVTVRFVREPTIQPRTALGRVVRRDLFNGDTAFWCFVLDVLVQAPERPDMLPLRLSKPLSNVGQILEHDNVAVVFDGFRDDFIGDCVNVLFAPCGFSLPEAKQGVVCGLRAALLHLAASLLELAVPVVVVVALPERAS
jgi:hypothetical protein